MEPILNIVLEQVSANPSEPSKVDMVVVRENTECLVGTLSF